MFGCVVNNNFVQALDTLVSDDGIDVWLESEEIGNNKLRKQVRIWDKRGVFTVPYWTSFSVKMLSLMLLITWKAFSQMLTVASSTLESLAVTFKSSVMDSGLWGDQRAVAKEALFTWRWNQQMLCRRRRWSRSYKQSCTLAYQRQFWPRSWSMGEESPQRHSGWRWVGWRSGVRRGRWTVDGFLAQRRGLTRFSRISPSILLRSPAISKFWERLQVHPFERLSARVLSSWSDYQEIQ